MCRAASDESVGHQAQLQQALTRASEKPNRVRVAAMVIRLLVMSVITVASVLRLRRAIKAGSTRLGFAVLLAFFELEARFPRAAHEVPPQAVAYLAEQVRVPAV